jgi:hypothetical protein
VTSPGESARRRVLVDDLTVEYQALNPAGDLDQILFVYTTEPGSASETSLRLLAHWHDHERHDTPIAKP